MKLFEIVRKLFKYLGIHPCQQHPNQTFHIKNLAVFSYQITFTTATGSYLVFRANSIYEYGELIFVFMTHFVCMCGIMTLVSNMSTIMDLIEKFEKFMQTQLRDPVLKPIFNQIDQQMDRMANITYFVGAKLSFLVIGTTDAIVTSVNYFIKDMGDESYFLASPLLLPFDWKTPYGYMVVACMKLAASFSATYIATTFICLMIGSCWTIKSFVKAVTNSVSMLKVGKLSNEKSDECKKRIRTIAQDFETAKQLVNEINDIFDLVFFVIFVFTLLTICGNLLILQLDLNESHGAITPDGLRTIFLTAWSFIAILTLCNLGQMLNSEFELFNDELVQCDWYSFPREVQKMYAIIHVNAQQSTHLQSYANIVCTRETMKTTISASFSYFTTFRQFI